MLRSIPEPLRRDRDDFGVSRPTQLLFSFLVPIFTVLICLAAAEGVLRLLPVSSGLHAAAVSARDPVFHFLPNRPFLHSLGWNMHDVNHGRINNAGFTNAQDYRRDDPLPLLAVIGDSYIEARMVPYADTLQGRLARMLDGQIRVYSFAAGGAPLSQYLVWAQYAVSTYGARSLVINVVGNDFDESLTTYKIGPGFWFYVPDQRGELHLRLVEHHPGWLLEISRHSALARYLVMNVGLQQAIYASRSLAELIFGRPAQAAPRYAGNTDATADTERVRASLAVIDAFFRDLPVMTGLPPQSILFTLDGFRYPDAAEAARDSYFDLMRRAFRQKARGLSYEVIDLDEWFIPHYQRTRKHFEYLDDAHWNGIGHGVAAEAVSSSQLLHRLRALSGG
jgi:hypothetical protein